MERIEHFRFVTQRSNGTRKIKNLKITKQQRIQKIFSSLMFKRKVNAALKMLSESNIRVRTFNDRLFKELSQKRLGLSQINKGVLLQEPINQVLISNLKNDTGGCHK